MKYNEFHRILRANKGDMSYVVPFHGAKEIGNDYAKRILKEMGIGDSPL